MKETSARRRAPADPRPTMNTELTRDEMRRLAKAERKLAGADPTLAASGRREIAELEHRRRERLRDSELAAGLAETAALARARGEEVRAERVRIASPAVDDQGARVVRQGEPVWRQETVSRVRICSRGGLQLAFERGDLDGGPYKAERLLEVGRAYRWAFEASTGLTTATRDLGQVSARAPLRSSAGPQDSVFAAGEALRVYRLGLGERRRRMLDQVCGLDMTVRAAAQAIKADPRTARRLLVEALTQASDNRAGGAAAGQAA
jgi:hypothetical protein